LESVSYANEKIKTIGQWNYFLESIQINMKFNLYGTPSENGKKLNLQNISENHAGRYTCTADNGVGNPVSEDITLKVLCKTFHFQFPS
jgi:hypothetical protein